MAFNTLPLDIIYVIASFIRPKQYRFRDGIPVRKLDKYRLSTHPMAVSYLIHHPDLVIGKYKARTFWLSDNMCHNSSDEAIGYLLRTKMFDHSIEWYSNPSTRVCEMLLSRKVNWNRACSNPNPLMVSHILAKMNESWNPACPIWWNTWNRLAENHSEDIVSLLLRHEGDLEYFFPKVFSHPSERLTTHLLTHYGDRIAWEYLAINPSDAAATYLLDRPHMHVRLASRNPNDMILTYLFANPDMISFDELSRNANPRALEWMMTWYPDQINWHFVSGSTSSFLFVEDKEETRRQQVQWVALALLEKSAQNPVKNARAGSGLRQK